ncbi:hypothetical protein Tsubulata_029493 [Turnera subulata]|uniref:Uncharacterized protein n=1 Tax=Turnera subulata TaxID=218843 RepID=A0A9Q0FIZ3_9ROSI|nr:hypothetical protein Tsubulata_029493 [Turnera subulata]
MEDFNPNDKDSFLSRIQQLEYERDELRKDIEQLCMQQAGPAYLAVATRMHFQRTAGLEQEIESLNRKLAASSRDIINLREELTEAYRIKTQLADLHRLEVEKNVEAEKQLKFFQGCVAAAFAERDHSIMEAEKAKEKEEVMSKEFHEMQTRLEAITSDFIEQKKLNDELQIGLAKQEEHIGIFKKVVNKFYEIREGSALGSEDENWDDKCASLLDDSADMWSYNDASTSKYIVIQSALEGELETARRSLDYLQSKLRMGLEIENHLKKKVRELEKKQVLSNKTIMNAVVGLRDYHSQHRAYIMNLLEEESFHIKLISSMVEEKMAQSDVSRKEQFGSFQKVENLGESECRDVHISTISNPTSVSEKDDHSSSYNVVDREENTSEALVQALQEKVAALLLLSQEEERHLLERNVNAALQKKTEELQRNLLQVTNEKVKALMELAQLKQEYQELQEKIGPDLKQGIPLADTREKKLLHFEGDGRLKNLLKKTNLRRWISGNDSETEPISETTFQNRRSNNVNFARMMIENATLKESLENMEHLNSSIHRLRLALLKVKESDSKMCKALDDIIYEAKLLKTALGSSLPVSWPAEADDESTAAGAHCHSSDVSSEPSSREKADSVSAAGFEMVELLIFAAQLMKDNGEKSSSHDGS